MVGWIAEATEHLLDCGRARARQHAHVFCQRVARRVLSLEGWREEPAEGGGREGWRAKVAWARTACVAAAAAAAAVVAWGFGGGDGIK